MPAIQLPVFVVVINFRAQLVYFFDLLGKFVLAGAAKEHRYQGFFFPGKCLIKGGHFRGGRILQKSIALSEIPDNYRELNSDGGKW